MRAVVAGLIASYPLGGMTWHYLHYMLGLRDLGWRVFYLEDTGQWPYDPDNLTFTEGSDRNVRYLSEVMAANGFDGAWAYRDHAGEVMGADLARVVDECRRAELFLNVSGACWLREEYRAASAVVYVDTDPGYSQARVAAHLAGSDDEDLAYSVARMAEHDHHFTFAEKIRDADCLVPEGMFDWQPTRQPIVTRCWRATAIPGPRRPYTSILSWSPYQQPLVHDGVAYWGKEPCFEEFIDLPRHVGPRLELAIAGDAPRERLGRHGWTVAASQPVSRSPDAYRDYVQGSRGEFSAAKDTYVRMRTGWFSERSACYLASARPVVVQDTGFSDVLPTGAGLHAVSSVAEAAEAIAMVEADYGTHAEAARAIATEHFDAEVVLDRLLADVWPGS